MEIKTTFMLIPFFFNISLKGFQVKLMEFSLFSGPVVIKISNAAQRFYIQKRNIPALSHSIRRIPLRMWRISSQVVMCRDETAYAYLIKHFLNGTIFQDGVYYSFPPAYPLLAVPVAAITGNPEYAGRFISILMGSAAAIPAFYLARDLFGRRAAIIAGVLMALFPPLMNCGVMSEPTYAFFIVLSLYLGNRAYNRRSLLDFFFFGLSMAAAYLSRPEGLFIFLAYLGLLFLLLLLKDRQGVKKTSALCAVGLAGFMLLAFPYMLQLHTRYGAWEISGKTRIMLAKSKVIDNFKPGENFDKSQTDVEQDMEKEKPNVVGNVLGELKDITARYPGNLKKEIHIFSDFSGYPFLFWFMLGSVALFLRRGGLWEWCRVAISFIPMLLIPMVAIEGRVIWPYLPAVIIIAAYGIAQSSEFIAAGLKKYLPEKVPAGIFAAFLCASAMFGNLGHILPGNTSIDQTLNDYPFLRNYYDYRQVAEQIRPYIRPGAGLITRENMFAYYAGAEYTPMPVVSNMEEIVNYAKETHSRYLIYGPTEQGMRPELMPYVVHNGILVDEPAPGMKLIDVNIPFLLYEFPGQVK